MRLRACLPAWAALVILVATVAAPARAASDPFKRAVFAPELVMKNQRRIELTADQRELFIREMQQTQSDLLPIQLEMSEIGGLLTEQLEAPEVDEATTLATAERLLDLERRTKLRHLELLIRIKNLLTPEQKRILRRIRDEA